MRRRLLIIGGGICGLAAAHEAQRLGVEVVVIEREPTVGGLLSTDRREGFSFDRGGHRSITGLPWVLERVREVLGDRLALRTRRSLVFFDGTTVEYPLRFGDLMRRLGPAQNLRAVLSYVAAAPARWRPSSPATLEQWLLPRFGRYLYERVFEGYSEKLWGHHPSQMSAEWAPQRISIPSLGGYLRQLVLPSRRPPRTYAKEFLYPHTGIGEFPERFQDAVLADGGTIHTKSRVDRLTRERGRWRATIDIEGDSSVERFDGVVATVSPTAVSSMLNGELRGKLRGELGGTLDAASMPLPNRGLRFLNLGFATPVPLDATWIYQPDPQCRFTRVQIPAARSPQMVPKGMGSIQLEEPHDTDDGSTLEDRVREGTDTLRALGLDLGPPTLTFESHAPQAYPIYRGGNRDRAGALVNELEKQPALRLAGRQGRFDYIFFDRAIAQGVNAARTLLGEEPFPEQSRANADRPISLVEAQSVVGVHV